MTYLVVIPAYNAAATIAGVLGRLDGHRDHTVVVDDGSTDATPEIVRRLGGELLGHERNRGVGAALRTGIRYARAHGYDRVVTLDADGQHDPRQVDEFLHALRDNDLVVGSRFLQEADGLLDAKVAPNLLAALIVNRRSVRGSPTSPVGSAPSGVPIRCYVGLTDGASSTST